MSKTHSSRDVIQMLKANGWFEVRVTGSHHHFKHQTKPGIVTVPHPKKELGKGLYNSILKQAKLKR
ncbi:MAG: addiction module toxin, HicA family [Gammaproteobacteria bacterium RIFCSPHIGHO2_12_FULL_38_11]|nr:MAG: addiction module toxin, HicA family [Gammaproteobacteria bacterium RIFCSPHIGHO2_12_FULL_38_11]